MKMHLLALLSLLIFLIPHAQAETTSGSDPGGRESTAWQRLQQATEPDIVAIRQILDILLQEHRPLTQPVAQTDGNDSPRPESRLDDTANLRRVRELEDRVRRLEGEMRQVNSQLTRLR